MLGALIGDLVGSVYEWRNIKSTQFEFLKPECFFTDDSVLTVATASALLTGTGYTEAYQDFARRYPGRGYGGYFSNWIYSDNPQPYNSWGNGSAMRVSPVGFAFNTVDEVLAEAEASAVVTHNHPEGIKGAQAAALSVFLARTTRDKGLIRKEIAARFGYDLDRTVDGIRPSYGFDVSCQGTVPEAIISFLEAGGYEDAVRNAVSLGGDSDTLACITGALPRPVTALLRPISRKRSGQSCRMTSG